MEWVWETYFWTTSEELRLSVIWYAAQLSFPNVSRSDAFQTRAQLLPMSWTPSILFVT